jgi:hypothetical protein
MGDDFSEEEFGRIFASQKPGFAGFRFAPFFALRAQNASRPSNPLRAHGLKQSRKRQTPPELLRNSGGWRRGRFIYAVWVTGCGYNVTTNRTASRTESPRCMRTG